MNVSRQVAAAAEGDPGAWQSLVDQFSGLVWATARGHRLSDADAADVVQTTWLRLVEHLGRLDEPERVGAWLVTTTRRECLRVIGASARTTPSDDFTHLTDGAPTADDLLDTQDRASALHRGLQAISGSCRLLLRVLAADPAPSYEDVSAALDMPIGSIGPTRRRCMDRLRKELEHLGITGQD
ncbi:MAG: sigma-70 family RNA polymerase sigma factor [Solirubrobacteraceae bacterium]|nr:sigma-70 family RNA polymerase sigma factor [Patulibacter sp.]